MPHVITAIYEQGVLQPLTPLNLQEHQRVQVRIIPERPQKSLEDLLHWLSAIGRLTPPRQHAGDIPSSETDREQLAAMLGNAATKPLSEIILEDRGEG
jgi:predicted DNA-binding antitoxin AbrB/MazE fold protein